MKKILPIGLVLSIIFFSAVFVFENKIKLFKYTTSSIIDYTPHGAAKNITKKVINKRLPSRSNPTGFSSPMQRIKPQNQNQVNKFQKSKKLYKNIPKRK